MAVFSWPRLLMASSSLVVVLSVVGLASPEWLVSIPTMHHFRPVRAIGLWTLKIENYKFDDDPEQRYWDGYFWIWTFWKYAHNFETSTIFVALQVLSAFGFCCQTLAMVLFIFHFKSAFCNHLNFLLVGAILMFIGGSLILCGVLLFYNFNLDDRSWLHQWLGPYTLFMTYSWGLGFSCTGASLSLIIGTATTFSYFWEKRRIRILDMDTEAVPFDVMRGAETDPGMETG